MVTLNENFGRLPGSYLFSEVARRVREFSETHPDVSLIKLGIGDVTLPLPAAAIDAMHAAVDDLSLAGTFQGYGPEQGHLFLRSAIAQHDFIARGVHISPDEIFVSDGAKSDCGNIIDLLGEGNSIAVCDPVYPVYVDSNAMAGRAGTWDGSCGRWSGLTYMPCTADNGFCPEIPDPAPDVVYLCSPNNPTGTALTFDQLRMWVDFANEHDALILFDAAYERFITQEGIPHSIYEVPGARTCAIELRSFSKTAGFTGARCGYTVIPHELGRGGMSLNGMWNRRQATKFNGASYISQRGAAAIYTPAGVQQVDEAIAYYLANAKTILNGLQSAGYEAYGGVNSPYIWCRAPEGLGSWDFFTLLLEHAGVVTTPGAGFGPSGEGYIRLTAFGDADSTAEAVQRICASGGRFS